MVAASIVTARLSESWDQFASHDSADVARDWREEGRWKQIVGMRVRCHDNGTRGCIICVAGCIILELSVGRMQELSVGLVIARFLIVWSLHHMNDMSVMPVAVTE